MGTSKRQRQKQNRQQVVEARARSVQRRRTRSRGIRIAIVAAIIIGMVGVVFVSGGSDSTPAVDSATTLVDPAQTTETREFVYGDGECPPADGSAEQRREFAAAPQLCIDPAKSYEADVVTNLGDFTIRLAPDLAPGTVNNFVSLARWKYYDDTTCHRVIADFVVQCGDPTATGSGGPGYQFADELPRAGEYKIGSIAMANAGPDTNGSQFFIITGNDGAGLPPNYTLFGEVINGLDTTVPAMAALFNPDPGANGVPPAGEIRIESVTIRES
jgi:peptidylprolyl isomerase/peptidyl-prolyl cis-trans isomerase B (cyclophilin B)